MNIEPNILLIIIGSIFILLGVAGKILIERFKVTLPTVPSRIVISVLGLILLFLGIIGPQKVVPSQQIGSPENSGRRTSNQPINLTIVQPRNGNFVPGEMNVYGTYSKEITDNVWVFIWPERARGRGWPQSDDPQSGAPALKKNGKWSVYCYFGGPPQRYEIAVYTATPAASFFISTKLKEWYKSGDYKGISVVNLPDGLLERQRIQVTKQK